MLKFDEPRIQHPAVPRLKIVESAIAPAVPPLPIAAARVEAEKHTAGLQCDAQLPWHARQLLARDVE
jgi:hypothetical protein